MAGNSKLTLCWRKLSCTQSMENTGKIMLTWTGSYSTSAHKRLRMNHKAWSPEDLNDLLKLFWQIGTRLNAYFFCLPVSNTLHTETTGDGAVCEGLWAWLFQTCGYVSGIYRLVPFVGNIARIHHHDLQIHRLRYFAGDSHCLFGLLSLWSLGHVWYPMSIISSYAPNRQLPLSDDTSQG